MREHADHRRTPGQAFDPLVKRIKGFLFVVADGGTKEWRWQNKVSAFRSPRTSEHKSLCFGTFFWYSGLYSEQVRWQLAAGLMLPCAGH
jgi:hypothetical protein